VRVYTVQQGDTPSSIAARDDMAGCPKCAKDLVEANTHRASVRHTNGYLTFAEPLAVGENLWLPDKWFDGTLDRLPRSYFDDLPKVPAGLGELPPELAAGLATMARRWSKLTERKPTRENHLKAANAHLAAAEQHQETNMISKDDQRPAYALAIRPGLSGVPYGQPYGPYGISYGLAQAAPAAPAAPAAGGFGGLLASLPSYWPWIGLAAGSVLAVTGIILMANKK